MFFLLTGTCPVVKWNAPMFSLQSSEVPSSTASFPDTPMGRARRLETHLWKPSPLTLRFVWANLATLLLTEWVIFSRWSIMIHHSGHFLKLTAETFLKSTKHHISENKSPSPTAPSLWSPEPSCTEAQLPCISLFCRKALRGYSELLPPADTEGTQGI